MTSKARYSVVIKKIDESTQQQIPPWKNGRGAEEQEATHEHSVKNGKEADEVELSTQNS
jgi:hypothetical protein